MDPIGCQLIRLQLNLMNPQSIAQELFRLFEVSVLVNDRDTSSSVRDTFRRFHQRRGGSGMMLLRVTENIEITRSLHRSKRPDPFDLLGACRRQCSFDPVRTKSVPFTAATPMTSGKACIAAPALRRGSVSRSMID
jgi:hypothetical protein